MKQLIFLLFVASVCVGCSVQAQVNPIPVAIPIQNPSFEEPSALPFSSDCGPIIRGNMTGTHFVPGWTFQYDSGLLHPTGCIPPPPDGQNVAFAQNSTLSQDTGMKAADVQAGPYDGFYTMKFYVVDLYGDYSGYYEAKVSLGPQELCSTDGWGSQRWTQVTLTCPSSQYMVFDQWPNGAPFDPNAHLVVSLSASGWQMVFDDVSLTFTPQ